MHKAAMMLAGVILGGSAGEAAPQSWTSVPDSSRRFTAAMAEWPSGVAMIARCASERGLDVMLMLAQPVDQLTVPVLVGYGEGEPLEQVWRLSDEGDLLFVRQPAHFSRAMIGGQPLEILVSPDEGPRQRYVLNSPDNAAALAEVVSACGPPAVWPAPEASIITNPEWVRRPTGREFARYYPRQAMTDRIDGDVVVQCRISVSGRIEDCITVSESPRGYGFGGASEVISESFWMRPPTADDEAFGEALINIPISWRMR